MPESQREGKKAEEKEAAFLAQETLSALSLEDIYAGFEIQCAWGLSDIFEAIPGAILSGEDSFENLSPFSLLKPNIVKNAQAFSALSPSQKGSFSVQRFLSERQKNAPSEPERAQIVSHAPAPLSISTSREALLLFEKSLKKARTAQEVLQIARENGAAGLARLAMHDIEGIEGEKGSGFIVSAKPSPEEERAGKIFAGGEGVLVKRLFASIGLSFDKFSAAPVLPWRPPGGRDPLPDEIEICALVLKRLIILAEPKWVVSFGKNAAQMLLESKKQGGAESQSFRERSLKPAFRFASVRGQWHEVLLEKGESKIPIFPLYDPARLKNSARVRKTMWQDLQCLKQGLEKF